MVALAPGQIYLGPWHLKSLKVPWLRLLKNTFMGHDSLVYFEYVVQPNLAQ